MKIQEQSLSEITLTSTEAFNLVTPEMTYTASSDLFQRNAGNRVLSSWSEEVLLYWFQDEDYIMLL